KLVLQGNREHDHLIFIAWFVFCHRCLYLIKPHRFALVINPLFRQFQRLALPAGGRSVDSAWEQE
ncbi:MAG: hypothetical protein ABIU06_04745, partial [Anaerolineales bacterium]